MITNTHCAWSTNLHRGSASATVHNNSVLAPCVTEFLKMSLLRRLMYILQSAEYNQRPFHCRSVFSPQTPNPNLLFCRHYSPTNNRYEPLHAINSQHAQKKTHPDNIHTYFTKLRRICDSLILLHRL